MTLSFLKKKIFLNPSVYCYKILVAPTYTMGSCFQQFKESAIIKDSGSGSS